MNDKIAPIPKLINDLALARFGVGSRASALARAGQRRPHLSLARLVAHPREGGDGPWFVPAVAPLVELDVCKADEDTILIRHGLSHARSLQGRDVPVSVGGLDLGAAGDGPRGLSGLAPAPSPSDPPGHDQRRPRQAGRFGGPSEGAWAGGARGDRRGAPRALTRSGPRDQHVSRRRTELRHGAAMSGGRSSLV